MSLKKKLFGVHPKLGEVYSYTLRNAAGMKVKISEYGGAVMQIKVTDRNGAFSDVICGYDSLDSYIRGDGYQGALVGRYGNRIANASFTLDGKMYKLDENDGKNCLHGGFSGLSSKVWASEVIDKGDEPSVKFSTVSADGEGGFPGTLEVCVTYKLTTDNALSIHYEARTDKDTPVNLTNHTYFNLAGYASGSVLGHKLKMDADRYIPTDVALIPTGEIKPVDGTSFDFRTEKTVGRDFDLKEHDLALAGGYDHCLVFSDGNAKTPVCRIIISDEKTGREMRVLTTQPCVQLYSGNFMCNPEFPFKGGFPQTKQNALCLETQKMPDSVNHKGFTDVILKPGEKYDETTIYKFGVRK